jgi:predicted transcriptional regulator
MNELQQKMFAHALIEAGYNQTDFAKEIGVSKQAVSQVLSGKINSQAISRGIGDFITENIEHIQNSIEEWNEDDQDIAN